jgi:hypothetical protein
VLLSNRRDKREEEGEGEREEREERATPRGGRWLSKFLSLSLSPSLRNHFRRFFFCTHQRKTQKSQTLYTRWKKKLKELRRRERERRRRRRRKSRFFAEVDKFEISSLSLSLFFSLFLSFSLFLLPVV